MAVAALLALAAAPPPPIYGFTPASAARERADEARLLDLPSAQGALDAAAVIGAHPHYAGTPADYALATWTRDRLAEYGLDARIEPFRTVVDTPKKLVVELFADGRLPPIRRGDTKPRGTPLDLREAGTPLDPATQDPAVGLPFNAGSADGDPIGPLVFANHGMPEDYAVLARAGVSVRGAVVLVRYGAAFRGLLAGYAQDAGAAGMILYDDPADDGAGRGATYPDGPWRPAASVQRGSVGEGIRIPVLPVSADNARLLLRALRGPAGPAGWSGGLDAGAYPLARGPALVHVTVEMTRRPTTLWNTVGVLRGTGSESVVLGAHRDAWVYGVTDNGSGTITLLETARALGNLSAGGRRPRRSVVIALWDGEEIGLRGSEAYVRAHESELRAGCIAYLNADQMLTGTRIRASAAGAIAPLFGEVARAVADPAHEHQTLRARWDAQRDAAGASAGPPGGGSDHTTFLTLLGTPVASFEFEGPFGPYHSSYDTARYAQRWADPGFALHRTAAQVYGLAALRLANADAPPYRFADYLPLLHAGLLGLEARAQRDGRSLGLAPVRSAVSGFGAAAFRHDAAAARGAARPGALAAAQTLDTLVYGERGYESLAYPELVAAYERNDPAAMAAAVERAAAAIDRAASEL